MHLQGSQFCISPLTDEMYGYGGLSLAIPSAQYCFVAPNLSTTDLHQSRKSSWSGKFSQSKATTLVMTFLATDCLGAFIASNGCRTRKFPLLT